MVLTVLQVCPPRSLKLYEAENANKTKKRSLPDASQSVAKFFKPDSENCSDVTTNAITKYLIKSMKPISEVEDEGFVQMRKEVDPAYKMPTRKTMRSKIQQMCDTVQCKLTVSE